ncbi:bile acid:sodium symporter [Chryseobacterium scophthalmum]|uniref:bile acid:sodium symporter n=1 Tax=Chryseobacterium scophthalmum TaxID=59733 RepID=UPI0026833FA2
MKLITKIFTKQNTFLFLLVAMVLMAKLIPFKESYNQFFNLSGFIDWGIAGIFLLYGLKLNLKEVVKRRFQLEITFADSVRNFYYFSFIGLNFLSTRKRF